MTNCLHDHGRWGKGDQLGACHLLTPERTLEALQSVRDGQILDLSQVIEIGAPRMAPNQSPYSHPGGTHVGRKHPSTAQDGRHQ